MLLSCPIILLKAGDCLERGNVTLLYSAKDEEHNNAEALRDYLKSKLQE
jgi:uncharacterized protein YeaO (DUF488 family)